MEIWIPVENSRVTEYLVVPAADGKGFCDVLVRFKDDSKYRYYDVPEAIVNEFVDTPSKGRYASIGFRPYRYERVRE